MCVCVCVCVCVEEREGGKSSPGVERGRHINSKGVGEWYGEEVVQGTRVKQPDHAFTTPTNDVRLTERQTPPGLGLGREM